MYRWTWRATHPVVARATRDRAPRHTLLVESDDLLQKPQLPRVVCLAALFGVHVSGRASLYDSAGFIGTHDAYINSRRECRVRPLLLGGSDLSMQFVELPRFRNNHRQLPRHAARVEMV